MRYSTQPVPLSNIERNIIYLHCLNQDCRHKHEFDGEEFAERWGRDTLIDDVRMRAHCTECGSWGASTIFIPKVTAKVGMG